MLFLSDVRDLIASFLLVEKENCYSGMIEDKKEKCIGVYHGKTERALRGTLGGDKNKKYDVKNISILVHYTKKQRLAENKANELYEKLKSLRNVTVNNKKIYFINMLNAEPVFINTDEKGFYEYVILCDFIYERS